MSRAAHMAAAALLAWPLCAGAAPNEAERPALGRTELPAKPTGPIALEHRLAAAPAVGTPLPILVTARVDAAVAGLRLEAHASAPGSVLVAAPEVVAAGDGLYSWQITVVPLAAQAGYLSIIVSGDVEGTAQAQSVTISLRSHGGGAPPVAAAAGGETLIALPVQETP